MSVGSTGKGVAKAVMLESRGMRQRSSPLTASRPTIALSASLSLATNDQPIDDHRRFAEAVTLERANIALPDSSPRVSRSGKLTRPLVKPQDVDMVGIDGGRAGRIAVQVVDMVESARSASPRGRAICGVEGRNDLFACFGVGGDEERRGLPRSRANRGRCPEAAASRGSWTRFPVARNDVVVALSGAIRAAKTIPVFGTNSVRYM